MPDLLSEDETRAVFADLRSSELPHVRPPGTEAVRTTVRRRKTTRMATIAGCAVLAVGGVWLGLSMSGTPSTPAAPLDRTTTEWGQIAAALMPPQGTPGFVAGASGPLDATVRDVDESASLGGYRLRVTCAGAGAIHVRLEAGGAVQQTDVVCGSGIAEAGESAREVTVAVPSGGPEGMAVVIEPDAAALHRAGFAYVVVHSVDGP